MCENKRVGGWQGQNRGAAPWENHAWKRPCPRLSFSSRFSPCPHAQPWGGSRDSRALTAVRRRDSIVSSLFLFLLLVMVKYL